MAAASIIASVITGGSNSHQTVAEELNAYATDFVNQGVLGTITSGTPATGAFAVTQDSSPDMGVTVLSGVAYVSGTPSGQDAQVIRARMTSNYTAYTINANASGSTKFDWIYLQLSATNANNPSLAADNVITLYTSRSTSNASDNGAPPTYGILLAVVTVANGASSITNANISDRRTQSSLSSVNSGSSTGWTSLGYALTYGANNGNKEFTVTTPNDLTGLLSPGMRLKISRSTTPPTQSMAFVAASSQYATKASPAGITFTGPFTCEAWAYLTSYTGNSRAEILSRLDPAGTTGGWEFFLDASGRVQIQYGTASSFTNILSYQSVPLNRWTHLAGVVTSVSSKTGAIYINGTSVPTTNTATAATTLTQAAIDLRIGASPVTPANTYFNGYLSEVRLWSVAQSAGSIQSNMTINLVGNETNLIGLWQGNGNFNDATSNANNLTATNGAIATQAANPYNATEYAIITKVSYSNPTTTVTLFTGDNGTIPNQTLNTPYYATVKEPFGFPADENLWRIWVPHRTLDNVTSNANYGSFLSGGWAIAVPTGSWRVGVIANGIYSNTTTIVNYALSSTALTGLGTGAYTDISWRAAASSASSYAFAVDVSAPQTVASMTTYVVYTIGATTGSGIDGTTTVNGLYARCGYL